MKIQFWLRTLAPHSAQMFLITDNGKEHLMQARNNGMWTIELFINKRINYRYQARCDNGKVLEECAQHTIGDVTTLPALQVVDYWRKPSWIDIFNTNPFKFRTPVPIATSFEIPQQGEMAFRIYAPHISSRHTLAIVGNWKGMGEWNSKKSIELHRIGQGYWTGKVAQEKESLQFSLALKDSESQEVIEQEAHIHELTSPFDSQAATLISDLAFEGNAARWKGAGTAIPIFSLRSKNDMGVGDLGDLKWLIDWAALTGQKVLQVLPINDTRSTNTWQDSYPYNIISAFAINPIYLCPSMVGELSNKELSYQYMKQGLHLNGKSALNYEAALKLKLEYAKSLYQEYGKEHLDSEDFKYFFKLSKSWLLPYTAYRILCQKHQTCHFDTWGDDATHSHKRVLQLINENPIEAQFIYFVQYHLWKQLSHMKAYAHNRGIFLKGDVTVGVSRYSADVWQHPNWFDTTKEVGAPPDYFSAHGQVWGFPLYCWQEMARDGYSWWRQRLGYMQQFFDAYRLDHILGFFRIWAVDRGETDGTKGKYYPQPHKGESKKNINKKWKENGLKHLRAITQSTTMLACGEDLGTRPDFIEEVMNELNILTLDLQRMPKDDSSIANPSTFPYRSVATTSTHDMAVLRDWWRNNRQQAHDYYYSSMHEIGDLPQEADTHLCEQIIGRHLSSPSMLAIIPLQDWLSIDHNTRNRFPEMERINNPSQRHYYWNYRMHLSLEELIRSNELNQKIKSLITQSGRWFHE